MARSISIDNIGFRNMKRGTDSIIVKYNEYMLIQLGIFCSYNTVSLITRDGIFLVKNAKLGTAANRFCNSLKN